MKMYSNLLILFFTLFSHALEDNSVTEIFQNNTIATTETTIPISTVTESVTTILVTETANTTTNSTTESPKTGCTCGIFLSGQFKKGSKEPPKGYPALVNEHFEVFPCNSHGIKLCSNKCLDVVSSLRNFIKYY